MSAAAIRLPLADARRVADRIVALLAPGCWQIEVAGSIRRKRPDIGDIEIVARPKMEDGAPASFFDAPQKVSALDSTLALAEASGVIVKHPERPANGARYKRLWIADPGIQLDLFLVLPPAEWGPIFTIRTGPASFSQGLVTALLRRGMRCEDGRVINTRDGEVRPCPDERAFFEACGAKWAEPEDRR